MMRDIRNLLGRANAVFDTVHVEYSEHRDALQMRRKFLSSLPGGGGRLETEAVHVVERWTSQGDAATVDERAVSCLRVWWQRGGCWRDEVVSENGAMTVNIVCDKRASCYLSAQRTLYTSEVPDGLLNRIRAALSPTRVAWIPSIPRRLQALPLLDSAFLDSGWELHDLGDAVHGGRAAYRVRATRLDSTRLHSMWDFVDDYEFLVDSEYGVFLRYAGIVDGDEASVLSAQTVRFNEPLPVATFLFDPPLGTTVVWAAG